jgi:radical SAM superfamily enzyme YgiQ (UPF0313 family)
MIDMIYPASVSGSENYSSEPPLGPIAVCSSLPKPIRKDVRFLDSTLLSQPEIEQAVIQRKADVVAVSCTTFNYPNALRLAELARRNGSQVVFGGIHVTYLRDAILTKMLQGARPIDFLVTGYGESALGPLLNALTDGRPLTSIPNLSFVKDGRTVVNPVASPRFGRDPLSVPLNYAGIDFKRYSGKFQPYGNLCSVRIVGTTFTQRGCAYAGPKKCTFCSIEQINPRRAPELFEQDVISLVTRHNVDHIRINDGDFTLDIRHMSRIADAAERAFQKTGSRPVFHCFTRADEVDEARISVLKRLNVVSVFIGYESGSNEMLRVMQKFTTKEQNLHATALLKEHGIDVICAGLVLGAEGESERTLSETLDFVRELKRIGNTHALLTTPLIPLPGSPSFSRLLGFLASHDPGKFRELAAADDFDLEELVLLWNRCMSKAPLPRLLEVCDEIADLFRVGIRFIELRHPNKPVIGP